MENKQELLQHEIEIEIETRGWNLSDDCYPDDAHVHAHYYDLDHALVSVVSYLHDSWEERNIECVPFRHGHHHQHQHHLKEDRNESENENETDLVHVVRAFSFVVIVAVLYLVSISKNEYENDHHDHDHDHPHLRQRMRKDDVVKGGVDAGKHSQYDHDLKKTNRGHDIENLDHIV